MKAIRVHQHGDPGVLRLEEVPEPAAGAGQVLVRIRAAGVNPVDTYIREGAEGYSATCPYIPGFDAAGEVSAIGEGVSDFETGERVYCSGTLTGAYAEYALCRPDQLYALPDDLSFSQGASIAIPYMTAYRALFNRAGAMPNRTLLVHGASGGVGLAAVQIAQSAGLRIFATAGSDAGRYLVRQQGADEVFDHHDPEHYAAILKSTGNRGVDIILEMLANKNLAEDLKLLAPNGVVAIVGSRGEIAINPRDLMVRESSVLGVAVMQASREEKQAMHEFLAPGLANGTFKPIIANEFKLEEASQAHKLIMDTRSCGNICLKV